MEFDTFMQSRILTGLTLGFHIIFATIGVGVPVMIMIAEWMGIRKNDPHYRLLARRWARGFTVTVAVGVVTGTAIGMQLSLLWPSFMQLAGQVIALPLFMETFAFFFEAIFLGIYLYTWDRFKKPIYHCLLVIPVVIGSSASAFFITTVNAFMNTPQGFKLENGVITGIEPLKAMFNPATPTKVAHVLSSAYLTSAFVLAAITAWFILRGSRSDYYQKALRLTMTWSLVFAIATAVIGDLSGKFLAEYQPEKLAAAEWHFETEKQADLILGGVLDKETLEVKGELRIPMALSILAGSHPDTEVTGLNEFPRDLWPPLYVHYLFDLMVGIGMYLAAVAGLFVLVRIWKKKHEWNPWLLRLIVLGGPLSMLAIELGWIFTEVGRQPWILRGFMRTDEGVTTSANVGQMLVLFSGLYAVLGIVCTVVLIRMFRKNPPEKEMGKRGIEGGGQHVV
ncbi:cytochrome ubiquinol oxidase subunit I [Effusibacillus lacus]|uniref:Cytochrome ubiquinol oxidase subunit I n=1 Tax=Effusibacillus lacus TaxID=1348429 RepID=A0A292YMP3_9BACL|nr:cytochrome ubiquinol oxidase subunit I [Effusibacillus lacus]TCS76521.1 cytochrome bd-I ubiquinol oxidase subunit 1 apoprotein [Effusibacillus lacus]GAX90456.1 cytochrome ubiquinol oxidase subunit I [Effusibacillus lacus]